MHSQSSEKSGTVESQTKSSKSPNNQIGTMTKRKQHVPSILQLKNSTTIDLPVVTAMQQMKAPPTVSMNSSNSPTKLVTLSKSQQLTSVRHIPSAPRTTLPRVSPNNGRTDIDDKHILGYQVQYQGPAHAGYAPTSSTISISMSTPHIGTHQNYHSNQYHSYPPQVQVQQSLSQPCHNGMGNRQNYSNRQNNSNKKVYHSNYMKSKRNGNMSADKNYNSSANNNNNNNNKTTINNNNNNNNNEYEYTIANKSARHLGQQFSRNRSYNCETSKNLSQSPQRDPYSSSSSSSSSSSMPSKKSIHHLHSPVIPQLISPISFQGDSRTTSNGYERDLYLINTPYTYTAYGEDVQNQIFSYETSYEWCRNDRFGRSMSHPPPQFQYTDPNTGESITLTSQMDGKSNHRMNKTHRGNNKNGTNNKSTTPDRFLNRAPYVEVKETPHHLKVGSKWDRISVQVWDKFMLSQQKEDTYTKKMKMWKNLLCTVQEKFSEYDLWVVGSTLSGFGSNASDVDMCLVYSGKNCPIYLGNDLRIQSAKILKDFEEQLKKIEIYEDFNLILAKVPILRFKDKFHECEIDLNFNNSVGLHNTHLMHCYGQLDWRLRPLVVVVKRWAQFHGINNAKEMTISSYSLSLMVIHFLQCAVSPAVLPCLHELYPNKFQKHQEIKSIDMNEDLNPYFSQNRQTLGELFLKFFDYYTHFDYTKNAISVRKGSLIPIELCKANNSPKNDPNQWKELCIEEPFDLTNTAHSCYDPHKFQWIKNVFSLSSEALNRTFDLKSIFEQPFMPYIQ